MKFEIAIELLEIEAERLARDHYDTHPYQPRTDKPFTQSCDGCGRAYEVKQELNALRKEVTT